MYGPNVKLKLSVIEFAWPDALLSELMLFDVSLSGQLLPLAYSPSSPTYLDERVVSNEAHCAHIALVPLY